MKKLMISFIMLIVILLSGCTKEYNLIIEDDKITEEFNIVVDNNDENQVRFNLNYYPLHANEKVMYDKEIDKKGNDLKAHFSYVYKPNEFVNANTINECFYTKEVVVDNEEYYYFKLEKLKECMSDYDLDINIITKNKVLNNNADEVKNNKYTWHLTNENKDNFKLEIKISKKNSNNSNSFTMGMIIGIIVIAVALVIFGLIIKINKSNKI